MKTLGLQLVGIQPKPVLKRASEGRFGLVQGLNLSGVSQRADGVQRRERLGSAGRCRSGYMWSSQDRDPGRLQ